MRSLKNISSLLFLSLVLTTLSPAAFILVRYGIHHDTMIILLLSLSVTLCLFSLYCKLPRLSIVIFFFLSILAVIDLIFIIKYNSALNANAISLLGETNQSELIDFLSAMPIFLWLFLLYFIFALIFCLFIPAKFNHIPWSRLFFYSFVVTLLISYYQYTFYNTDSSDTTENQTTTSPTANEQNYFSYSRQFKDDIVRTAFPANLPFILADYYYQRKEMRHFADLNKDYSFNAKRQSDSTERQVYILVIGESGRADHWGINGYFRNTSPMLSQRNDIISFQKMYTFFPFTRFSVPIIISRKPINSEQDYFEQPSIVTYFKQIGFDTAWISLQAPFGKYDSPVSVYAYEANHVQFLNPVDYTTHGKYDYEAIPDIIKQITSSDQNLFIVVHTLGNHLIYSDRYDERMRVFVPDRYEDRSPNIFNKDDQEILTNSYDNSIIAVDYFLGTLIQQLEKLNASSFIFYISDHGQGLFDDGNYKAGHGYQSSATVHVPAFFWASSQYIFTHQQAIANMKANSTQLTGTDMVFETLVSLSDGVLPDSRPHLDLTKNNVRATPALLDMLANMEKNRITIRFSPQQQSSETMDPIPEAKPSD